MAGLRGRDWLVCGLAGLLCACGAERRAVGPAPPLSPPANAADPRIARFESNAWEVSQGGRLFAWYGCQNCHGEAARGALDLADSRWRRGGEAADIYRDIAGGLPGMPAYGSAPPQQLWELTAFVRKLPVTRPSKRRRADVDQAAEPSGVSPTGVP